MTQTMYASRIIIIYSAVFPLIYSISPLYSSNQNTYFLHGIANAGFGHLANDWLVGTIDPFPLFSFIVTLITSYLTPFTFYVLQFALSFIYIYSLVNIIVHICRVRVEEPIGVSLLVLLLIIHSAAASYLTGLLGVDVRKLFTEGVANQLVLSTILQPSMFGVLLFLSLFHFLKGKPFASAAIAAIPPVFHASYCFPAALLILGYMLTYYREKRSISFLFLLGGIPMAMVLPLLIYYQLSFSPSNPEIWLEAVHILRDIRIPHHMQPNVWFDITSVVKILLISYAAVLLKNTRLIIPFLLFFIIGVLLTLIQVSTGSETLSLLFPWRTSVFLVPLASAVVSFRSLQWVAMKWDQQRHPIHRQYLLSLKIIVFVLAIVGCVKMALAFDAQGKTPEFRAMQFISGNSFNGGCILVPLSFDQFRLVAGEPIVVDWKSTPYHDHEIVEWYARTQQVESFYAEKDSVNYRNKLSGLINNYHLAGFVRKKSTIPVLGSALDKIYENEEYEIFRVNASSTE
jgi:hypothetical protein